MTYESKKFMTYSYEEEVVLVLLGITTEGTTYIEIMNLDGDNLYDLAISEKT